MRHYATQIELEFIPNVNYKREHIIDMYNEHCDWTDPEEYFMEQLELNPKLLSWLFDDNRLIGKSYLSLESGRLEAFQSFCSSLDVYAE